MSVAKKKLYVVGSSDQEWYCLPVEADSPGDAVEKAQLKPETGDEYVVFEVYGKVVHLIAELALKEKT